MDRFDHGGATLLVDRRGVATGATFVLVHGIGVASRYYRRLAAVLSGSGRVHTVELPGHGSAPEPSDAMTIGDFAELIGAYLDAEDIVDPVLIGHSMGAQIVTELALQRPETVRRIVLVGAVVDPLEPGAATLGARLLVDGLVESPGVDLLQFTDYLRCGPRWFAKTLPAMMSYSLAEALPRLRADTLVIRGVRDVVSRHDWNLRMTSLAPGARLVELAGGAHVVMYTAPDAVAAVILEHADRDVRAWSDTEEAR